MLDTAEDLPGDVASGAGLLAGRVDHDQIISSIPVYARDDIANDENSPLARSRIRRCA